MAAPPAEEPIEPQPPVAPRAAAAPPYFLIPRALDPSTLDNPLRKLAAPEPPPELSLTLPNAATIAPHAEDAAPAVEAVVPLPAALSPPPRGENENLPELATRVESAAAPSPAAQGPRAPEAVRPASLWQSSDNTRVWEREAIRQAAPREPAADGAADAAPLRHAGAGGDAYSPGMLATAFLAGIVACPLLIGLALVRFLRRSQGPLFRIEIVGLNPGAATVVWPTPAASSSPAEEAPTAPEAARRGAVSLDPPPLELPVEETFVARRRREQSQHVEAEQMILQQLFEENVELRRRMEESE
jgi:hypothetical protein